MAGALRPPQSASADSSYGSPTFTHSTLSTGRRVSFAERSADARRLKDCTTDPVVAVAPVAAAVAALVSCVFLIGNAVEGDAASAAVNAPALLMSTGYLVWAAWGARLTPAAAHMLLALLGSNMLVLDWRTAGVLDAWALVPLLIVATGSGGRLAAATPLFLTAVTLLYLAVAAAEDAAGIGLYGLRPRSAEASAAGAATDAVLGWFVAAKAFVLRSSLVGGALALSLWMRRAAESAAAAAALEGELANLTARAVSRFELDKAEQLVDHAEGLECADSFRALISSMRHYRPYLPNTLFQRYEHDEFGDVRSEPLTPASYNGRAPPEGSITIAFTDIQSSTHIWEIAQGAMRTALKTHNAVLRRTLERCRGYEVKTIGDAFMVAFDTAYDAVRFCLKTQERLAGCEWPAELLALPDCRQVEGAWNGLRVRMGVHSGDVELEENPVTCRSDYFGKVVNKAARLVSTASGGAIAVSEEVLASLRADNVLPLLGSPVVIDRGMVKLKGIPGESHVFFLVPSSLAGRRGSLAAAQVLPRQPAFEAPRNDTGRSGEGARHHPACRGGFDTFLKLEKKATVAHTRVEFSMLQDCHMPLDAVNQALNVVVDSTSRLEGTVASVNSTAIISCWNTTRRCVCHLQNAVRFVGQTRRLLAETVWDDRATVGLCAGSVLHGNVGSRDSRYVMVIGTCVEVAGSLAAAARELGAFALHAAMPGSFSVSSDPAMRCFARPVDRWLIEDSNEREIAVEQLNVRALGDLGAWADHALPRDAEGVWWSDVYRTAFEARDISKLSQCADPVVKHVVLNLREQTRPRKIVPGCLADSPSPTHSSAQSSWSSSLSRLTVSSRGSGLSKSAYSVPMSAQAHTTSAAAFDTVL